MVVERKFRSPKPGNQSQRLGEHPNEPWKWMNSAELKTLETEQKVQAALMRACRQGKYAEWKTDEKESIARALTADLPWVRHHAEGRMVWPGIQRPGQTRAAMSPDAMDMSLNDEEEDSGGGDATPSLPPPLPLPRPPTLAVRRERDRRRQDHGEIFSQSMRAAHFDGLPNRRVTFKRIIGKGGYGLAALYEMVDNLGNPHEIVCKVDLGKRANVGTALDAEKDYHWALGRAKHVVQMFDLEELLTQRRRELGEAGPPLGAYVPGDSRDDLKEIQKLDESGALMFMEYMKYGDLGDILSKVAWATPKVAFSDKILWSIFNCLWNGLQAMACPPRHRGEGGSRVLPFHGNWLDEKIRESPPDHHYKNMIHFDLDPTNILVTDPDSEHPNFPILKIADLGMMVEVDDEAKLNPLIMQKCRFRGKVRYFAPEQFSEEWDWVQWHPDLEQFNVAGHYEYHTNLYWIAKIMWNCITLAKMPDGYPVQVLEESPGPDGNPSMTWSYGVELLSDKYGHVDVDLRKLIAQCMCDDPEKRPKLMAIQRFMDLKIQQLDLNAADPACERFCRDLFGEPGPATNPGAGWNQPMPGPMVVTPSLNPFAAPPFQNPYAPPPRNPFVPDAQDEEEEEGNKRSGGSLAQRARKRRRRGGGGG